MTTGFQQWRAQFVDQHHGMEPSAADAWNATQPPQDERGQRLSDAQILAGVNEFADENYYANYKDDILRCVRTLLATSQPVAAEVVKAFDLAVSAELPYINHLAYDSHEICKYFAENVRKRLAGSDEGKKGKYESS